MALADYYLCDVCVKKTFYDAQVNYDRVGYMQVICKDCFDEWEKTEKAKDTLRARLEALVVELEGTYNTARFQESDSFLRGIAIATNRIREILGGGKE